MIFVEHGQILLRVSSSTLRERLSSQLAVISTSTSPLRDLSPETAPVSQEYPYPDPGSHREQEDGAEVGHDSQMLDNERDEYRFLRNLKIIDQAKAEQIARN